MHFSAFIAHGLWLELFHVHLSSRLQCFNVHFAMRISFKCTCGREFRVETSVMQKVVRGAVEHRETPERPAEAKRPAPIGLGPEEERPRPRPPPSAPPAHMVRRRDGSRSPRRNWGAAHNAGLLNIDSR